MGANGNINDLELAKFIELAGQYGIRVHILHGDNWAPAVANLAALPATGNTTGDIRQLLDTGVPYRWDGISWNIWSTSGTAWGVIAGTLSAQEDLQAALDAKMGAGAYVLVSQDSLLTNQINLGSLTSGILKIAVSAGIATISILTDNSGNWDTAYTHSQVTSGNPHNVTKSEVGLGNVDNTSDMNKPVSTAQAAADIAALNSAKAYADTLVVGLLDDRGNYNASGNTFPASGGSGTAGAILKGDLWTVSVGGTIGGTAVTEGDIVRAIVDTPGQTSTNWAIAETNIGFTPENSTNKATTMTGNEVSNTLYLSAKAIYDWAVGLFVQKNGAITGATKTKVTYDTKGLVTAGSDATTADIADSADKRYVTDAEKTKLANTSGTNAGDETLASIGTKMFTATGKTTPVDADGFFIFDSAASNALKTLTFTNLKEFLKTWIDSLTTTFTNKTIAFGNNTISGTMAQFDTACTDGNFVYSGGALGTPASGNLDNCTADGTNKVGSRNIPQNSQSAAYTLVLTDAGNHIYHPSADTTARTWTIPSNASVAFPIGTAVTFVNDTSAGALTIAITTDTLVLAGTGTTGSRTLTANGIATAIKVTSTRWIISGTNLT